MVKHVVLRGHGRYKASMSIRPIALESGAAVPRYRRNRPRLAIPFVTFILCRLPEVQTRELAQSGTITISSNSGCELQRPTRSSIRSSQLTFQSRSAPSQHPSQLYHR